MNSLGLLRGNKIMFIGIAPKVYGAMDIFGKCYTKIKGFKDSIDFETLESILKINNSVDLTQKKWLKNMNSSQISIKVSSYDLKPNKNKRFLVYLKGIFCDTENITVHNNKKVN